MDGSNPKNFTSLPSDQRARIMDTTLLIYECEGTETEIKQWFETINIAGIPLNTQELLNAIYSGPFVTKAKEQFSNSQNANIQKWSTYISGAVNRQDFLERALECVSHGDAGAYMAAHRNDTGINELRAHFDSVIGWVQATFLDAYKEMRGLEWGRLYDAYHATGYHAESMAAAVRDLMADPCVTNRRGIFEYLLGGRVEKKLLVVRVFDEKTKRAAYARQTQEAEARGKSNCPLCALGDNANKTRIYRFGEMDADHVSAWSKGGDSSAPNCEMLCVTHNRAKGNR